MKEGGRREDGGHGAPYTRWNKRTSLLNRKVAPADGDFAFAEGEGRHIIGGLDSWCCRRKSLAGRVLRRVGREYYVFLQY